MKEITTHPGAAAQRTAAGPKIIALAAIILLLIAGGYLAYTAWGGRPAAEQTAAGTTNQEVVPPDEAGSPGQAEAPIVTRRITESELEEEYGLRVRLLAVTAAGGLIDFRLKVVDPEKAAQLLAPGEALPQLVAKESGDILQAPPVDQDLKLENGIIVFGLYPNAGHAIVPGTTVSVQFGSLLLEPIIAQ